MRYCVKCGEKLQEGKRFCVKCGYEVKKSKPVEAISERTKKGAAFEEKDVVQESFSVRGESKNRGKLLVVVALVAVVAVIAMLSIGRKTDDKTNKGVNEGTQVQSEASKKEDSGQEVLPLQPSRDVANATLETLRDRIESTSGGETVITIADDFDHDGVREAFAVVGTTLQEEGFGTLVEGEIWFATYQECYRIREKSTYYKDSVQKLHFGPGTYFAVEEFYATGVLSYLWGVEKSSAVAAPISGRGGAIDHVKGSGTNSTEFTMEHSAYDGCADGTGHTWKPYYFYWDKGMHEYGGKNLSSAEFCMYEGGKELLDRILSEGYIFTDIFYRNNGVITINYHSNEGFNKNATVILEDGSVQLVAAYNNEPTEELSESDYGGVYMPALVPEIAVYP